MRIRKPMDHVCPRALVRFGTILGLSVRRRPGPNCRGKLLLRCGMALSRIDQFRASQARSFRLNVESAAD